MTKANSNYDKLPQTYLFVEIAKRTAAYQAKNPKVKIMRLGIGNTTEPLGPIVTKGLVGGAKKLEDVNTYSGYGDEQGDNRLRSALAAWYQKLGVKLEPGEIFVSDGAKPDTANIESIFDKREVIAICDPVYPVYRDSNIIAGRKIVYLACTDKNEFFPELPKEKVGLVYLCSPNNPTGAVASRAQLKKFVDWANKNKAVIIFDAAYSFFVSDKKLPRSIYEIPGAKRCAIEISSFSKFAGFCGVRLGWTVVPHELGKLNALWNRRQTTMFNGASNIAQEGGLAALSPAGQKECLKTVSYYMENAKIIKNGLVRLGLVVFGGENAPYLWVKTPKGLDSWSFFDKLLSEAHVVGTPGAGFGKYGEGYFRLSAFGHRADIVAAVESIKKNLML
ncbi:MAG TPA: LL-diaminopimelate aminotransferase [Candidatus Saccharimonadales bacterium]|nr:LL-diaminopimelate aminotransferase [Candidatus Saccharimonadales bacterium]